MLAIRIILIAGVAAALAAAPGARAQLPDDDPRLRLVAKAGDRFLAAHAGDYCLTREDERGRGHGCLDSRVDVDALRRMRIGPGEVLELRPTVGASEVRVLWGRADRRPEAGGIPLELGRIEASPVADTAGTRWRATLPRRARRATYLRVLARYGSRHEWVSFYVGVRIHRPGGCAAQSGQPNAQ